MSMSFTMQDFCFLRTQCEWKCSTLRSFSFLPTGSVLLTTMDSPVTWISLLLLEQLKKHTHQVAPVITNKAMELSSVALESCQGDSKELVLGFRQTWPAKGVGTFIRGGGGHPGRRPERCWCSEVAQRTQLRSVHHRFPIYLAYGCHEIITQ